MSPRAPEKQLTAARMSAQGALLFTGFGLAQAMSFARNALLGHALSPRDFGIAASITLLLQLVETLSDLGSDRLIVQAEDGDRDGFVATTHTVLVGRGILLCLVMLLCAPLAADFFAVPEAETMFLWAAAVPLIKGFSDLDCRRAQRRFDNRPQLLVEIIPQAIALFATLPMVRIVPGYASVVVLALMQAAAAVLVSRMVSTQPYRLAAEPDVVRRLIAFGWPILLSALPLIAVYQGDRAIVGRMFGVELLAAYSAAFMITMVPGLLAARAGHALMLPLFADALRNKGQLKRRFAMMSEATTLLASVYLSTFVIAGGMLLGLAFGAHYRGYGDVVAWLAAMWSLRMLQAVPGMALMAAGETKPFLTAGMLRAAVLPLVALAAINGYSLALLAAIGCAGELASLVYVAARVERLEFGLGRILMQRALFLLPAGIASTTLAGATPDSLLACMISALVATSAIAASAIALMPGLRGQTRLLIAHSVAAMAK